jgi:hypothetical protein
LLALLDAIRVGRSRERALAQRLLSEGLSLRDIAERMHDKGIKSKAGTMYSAKSVARMLERT